MDTDFDAIVKRYMEFNHTLSDERVEGLRDLASPDVRWRDPWVDARGIDNVVAYMHKWYKVLNDIRFQTKDYSRNGQIVFLHMLMTFYVKKKPREKVEIDYICKVTLDDSGLVLDVREYWDATPALESIPLLGKFVALTKKLMQNQMSPN